MQKVKDIYVEETSAEDVSAESVPLEDRTVRTGPCAAPHVQSTREEIKVLDNNVEESVPLSIEITIKTE